MSRVRKVGGKLQVRSNHTRDELREEADRQAAWLVRSLLLLLQDLNALEHMKPGDFYDPNTRKIAKSAGWRAVPKATAERLEKIAQEKAAAPAPYRAKSGGTKRSKAPTVAQLQALAKALKAEGRTEEAAALNKRAAKLKARKKR